MKKLMLSLTFLGLTSLCCAQKSVVKFETNLNWSELKAKAKSSQKCIFIDVFATWCAPCKAMEEQTFHSPEVGEYVNGQFISARVQTNRTKNDSKFVRAWYSDADRIVKEFSVDGYPTFLFFSPDGLLVHRGDGYLNDEDFKKLATKAVNVSHGYNESLSKYNRGELPIDSLRKLALTSKLFRDSINADKIASDLINNHLLKMKSPELFTIENLNFVGDFLGSPESPAINFFLKNSDSINAVLGDYQTQNKIMDFIDLKYLPQSYTWNSSKPNWERIEQMVSGKFGLLGQERVWGQRMLYHYVLKDDWQAFAKFYVLYFKRALKHPRYVVNNMSWPIFKFITDPEVLKFACDVVMKYSMEEWYQNDALAYDTYANLLYKIGRKEQAITWQKRAVKMSNNDPGLLKTLEKMSKGKPTWTE